MPMPETPRQYSETFDLAVLGFGRRWPGRFWFRECLRAWSGLIGRRQDAIARDFGSIREEQLSPFSYQFPATSF